MPPPRPTVLGRGPRSRSRLLAGAPPLRLLASEAPRAAAELVALWATSPLLAAERRGDGHPVLVLPGLLGGDASTLVLRRYLTWLGYRVHGWDPGRRGGSGQTLALGPARRLEGIARDAGRRVSVVGWSLGGMHAHELARRSPSAVRQVVTLGSPLRLAWSAPVVSGRGRLRAPATAVYTRGDGIVDWRACRVAPGSRRQNVEVYGSHYGLATNPTVLHLLADRLAQPPRSWKPFSPGLVLRHLYP